jgi:hypothetical protein
MVGSLAEGTYLGLIAQECDAGLGSEDVDLSQPLVLAQIDGRREYRLLRHHLALCLLQFIPYI